MIKYTSSKRGVNNRLIQQTFKFWIQMLTLLAPKMPALKEKWEKLGDAKQGPTPDF